MTKEEIIKYAKSDTMPEEHHNMTCPELLLFYVLRDIYRAYRKGAISVEKGEVQRNLAIKQFEINTEELESAKAFLTFNAKMWQLTEAARNNYRINRTLENADALVEAWDGAKARKDVIATE